MPRAASQAYPQTLTLSLTLTLTLTVILTLTLTLRAGAEGGEPGSRRLGKGEEQRAWLGLG